MQDLLSAGLELPILALLSSLFAFYFGTAALLVWVCFRSRLSGQIQRLRGVVAPFFVSTAIIFELLVGFLSNDIWDRNRQAFRAVMT